MFGIFNSLADVNVWYRWDAPKLSENDFSNRKCLTGFGNFLNICWPYGIVQQFLSDLAAAESFIIHTVSIFIQQFHNLIRITSGLDVWLWICTPQPDRSFFCWSARLEGLINVTDTNFLENFNSDLFLNKCFLIIFHLREIELCYCVRLTPHTQKSVCTKFFIFSVGIIGRCF